MLSPIPIISLLEKTAKDRVVRLRAEYATFFQSEITSTNLKAEKEFEETYNSLTYFQSLYECLYLNKNQKGGIN
jgi:hypothetical protein